MKNLRGLKLVEDKLVQALKSGELWVASMLVEVFVEALDGELWLLLLVWSCCKGQKLCQNELKVSALPCCSRCCCARCRCRGGCCCCCAYFCCAFAIAICNTAGSRERKCGALALEKSKKSIILTKFKRLCRFGGKLRLFDDIHERFFINFHGDNIRSHRGIIVHIQNHSLNAWFVWNAILMTMVKSDWKISNFLLTLQILFTKWFHRPWAVLKTSFAFLIEENLSQIILC